MNLGRFREELDDMGLNEIAEMLTYVEIELESRQLRDPAARVRDAVATIDNLTVGQVRGKGRS